MATKKNREIIFNKYGGKCAYCGTELQKGWHVDELLPVRRKQKLIPSGYYHKITKELKSIEYRAANDPDYEWKDSRLVPDGMEHPERLNIDNQMPSCPSCNINKHSNSLECFRDLIFNFKRSLNRDSVQYKVAKRYGLIIEVDANVVFYFEKIEKLNGSRQI